MKPLALVMPVRTDQYFVVRLEIILVYVGNLISHTSTMIAPGFSERGQLDPACATAHYR